MDEEKRQIAGEPEDFDDFANAWYDDNSEPIDETVGENPKGNIFPLPDILTFCRQVCEAKSLEEARDIVASWQATFARRSPKRSVFTVYHQCTRLMHAIDGMRDRVKIEPHYSRSGKKEVIRYEYPVFSCGNMKLPFWTWSKLPVFTCPGRGVCASYCYSMKAMMHGSPGFMFAQNTLLMHFRPDIVVQAFALLKAPTVLRLHVDGDFENVQEIKFWMSLLNTRPAVFENELQVDGISSYVYSKSWKQLIAYDDKFGGKDGAWPEHFFINISSGGKWEQNEAMIRRLMKIPAVRGPFVVIDDARMPRRLPGQELTEAEMDAMAEARFDIVSENLKRNYPAGKWFTCRGKCAICVKKRKDVFVHACGHEDFRGVVIGVGKH